MRHHLIPFPASQVSGEYPWEGTSNMAIIYRVAVQGVRNKLPDDPTVSCPRAASGWLA